MSGRADRDVDKTSWARAPRNEEAPMPSTIYPEEKQEEIQATVVQMHKVYQQGNRKAYESQLRQYVIWHSSVLPLQKKTYMYGT